MLAVSTSFENLYCGFKAIINIQFCNVHVSDDNLSSVITIFFHDKQGQSTVKLGPSGHHYGRPTAINGHKTIFPITFSLLRLFYDRSLDGAATGQYFQVKNPFLPWHNGRIENFKMEWLLNQSFNDYTE